MGGEPRYGWMIVAALGVTETVSYGILAYAFSVLLVPMQHDLGWSRPTLTGAYSLAILVSGVASIWVGRLLDRRSPRLVMSLGSALAAVLVFAWSRISSVLELYLVFAGLGVAMALVLYEPAFIVVTKWFNVRRRAALTTLTLIAAFASFIFSPLTQSLQEAHGWRHALAVLALVLAVVTIPLHALVLRRHPDVNEHRVARNKVGRRQLLRRNSFWLLNAAFVLNAFATAAIAVHLIPLLVDHGHRATFAAFAAGLLGLAQIPGRLVFAVVARRIGVSAVPPAVFALAAAAFILLAVNRSPTAILIFVVAFGMSNGMSTLLRATLVGDLYGAESFGAISGLFSASTLGARAVAPFAAALIALSPGHDTTLLVVLALASAIAAGVASRGTRAHSRLLLPALPEAAQ